MKRILCLIIPLAFSPSSYALELLCQDTSSYKFIDYKFIMEGEKATGEILNQATGKLIKREYDVKETDLRFKLSEIGGKADTVFINRLSSNFHIVSFSKYRDHFNNVTSYGRCIKAEDRVF